MQNRPHLLPEMTDLYAVLVCPELGLHDGIFQASLLELERHLQLLLWPWCICG